MIGRKGSWKEMTPLFHIDLKNLFSLLKIGRQVKYVYRYAGMWCMDGYQGLKLFSVWLVTHIRHIISGIDDSFTVTLIFFQRGFIEAEGGDMLVAPCFWLDFSRNFVPRREHEHKRTIG